MDCREFEAELDRRLDERLDPRVPELTAHAEHCVGCGERLRDALVLLRGVTAWKRGLPAHAGDLAARITRDVAGGTSARPPVRRSAEAESGKWQAWMVVAGSIAAMWLMLVGSPFQDSRGTDQRVAAIGYLNSKATTPTASDRVPVTTPQADLDTVLVSAEGAYSQLADKTLEAAQDFALLWPTSQAVSDTASPSSKPQSSDANWNQTWPRELTPIGNSIGDALDFLRRAAPNIEKSAS